MNKHKVKHHRKQATENHIKTTALEQSVMNYELLGGGLNRYQIQINKAHPQWNDQYLINHLGAQSNHMGLAPPKLRS